MKKYKNFIIIIGLILGIILGIFLPNVMKELSFLGIIYVNLLKFMIVPVVFTSVMATVYKSNQNKNKIFFKTIGLFIIMFILTFLLTSLIVVIFKPGVNFDFNLINWDGKITDFVFKDIIVNLFPTNISTIISNNAIFPVLLVSFFSGIACTKIKDGKKVIELVETLKNLSFKLLEFIVYLTPIGIFSLIGSTIASFETDIIKMGGVYILFAYICSIIALIFVMILPAWIFGKVNPITYIKKAYKVWIMTFTTCSSAATLPTTIKVCNEEFKTKNKVTDIVVPLGCTIHMCGGAVSFALLGLFCCQLFNIPITFMTFIIMICSSTLINMAAPGIPGGGIVIGATYLSLLGIPISFIGFYGGIYKIIDMIYTTLNVTGDITANIIINKRIKN